MSSENSITFDIIQPVISRLVELSKAHKAMSLPRIFIFLCHYSMDHILKKLEGIPIGFAKVWSTSYSKKRSLKIGETDYPSEL